MNKIIKIIIILIIVMVVLILLIFGLNKNIQLEVEEYTSTEISEKVQEKNNNGFERILDSNAFYNVLDVVNTFIDIYQLDVEKNAEYEENLQTDILSEIESEKINKKMIKDNNTKNIILYSLLDKKYIEKNNITEKNVQNFIIDSNSNIKLIPIEMKVKYSPNYQIFLLQCYVENIEKHKIIRDKYFIIRTDNKNYSIEPVFNEEYEKIDEVEVDLDNTIIEDNEYNTFPSERSTIAQFAQKYIEHYRYLSVYHPEVAYNYLEEEYRELRFGSLDNYKQYIDKNIKELSKIQVASYLLETDDEGNRQYVCRDQYDNMYVFNEQSILKYTLLLDTYTLENEKFAETYNTSDVQNKVMMNVDKWIQMINNRDYPAAFNVLDETFRNNNFNGDVNEFESYMRAKCPEHYDVEYVGFDEQPGDIYSQEITLSEKDTEVESKLELTIIMKLKEDTNFVMSFSKDS